jgi:hypothetical protein
MKVQRYRALLAAVILVTGSAVLLAGCMGMGGSASSTTSSLRQARISTTAQSLADASQEPVIVAPADAYSSFQSKDPFVQQVVPTETTQHSTATSVTPPTASSTTTSTTTPSGSTSTTASTSTTTTSSSTTSTTSFFAHMLQIYQLRDDNGTATVIFMVDNTTYTCKENDTVSTSWGEIQVAKIDMGARVVTLLHNGQMVLMNEGQFLFE